MMNYKNYFGFVTEPFAQDIKAAELYPLPALSGLCERIRYAVEIGAVTVITGDVGTGKSTALRYACSRMHPSRYKIIAVTANSGTVMEFYRQVGLGVNVESRSPSVTTVIKTVRTVIEEILQRKETPVLIVDEAHLLRIEVFGQMHTLFQYQFDSKGYVPVILSGHNALLDKLKYHTSRPIASRVVGKSLLEGLKLKEMQQYLKHHLEIAGVKEQLFTEESVLSIQQNSGGLLRRANALARGALIAASIEQTNVVTGEHVRIASTEII